MRSLILAKDHMSIFDRFIHDIERATISSSKLSLYTSNSEDLQNIDETFLSKYQRCLLQSYTIHLVCGSVEKKKEWVKVVFKSTNEEELDEFFDSVKIEFYFNQDVKLIFKDKSCYSIKKNGSVKRFHFATQDENSVTKTMINNSMESLSNAKAVHLIKDLQYPSDSDIDWLSSNHFAKPELKTTTSTVIEPPLLSPISILLDELDNMEIC